MERFSIPSKFSLTNDNIIKNNPSFHAVKLRMMSSGKNWNGSDFIIESLDLAKDTVSYAPILANIVQRDDGELDCNGHDIDFEMKVEYNGNVTFKETYIEKPVGVFLANSCEKKYDEENDVYYLEALGYIWKQYSDVYDILKRDEVKDVSVEIEVEEGSFRDDGYYEIRQFNLLGCTILGNGNLPAIDHSRIEFNFSMDKTHVENLEKLNVLLQEFILKGGESMENEEIKVEEEVVEENATFEVEEPKDEEQEKCPECGKPLDECECEEVIEEEKSKEENKEEEEYSHEEVVGEAVSEEVDERIYTQVDLDLAVERTIAEFSEAMEELERLREFKAEYDRKIALQELNDKMDTILVNFNVNEDLVKELKEKVVNGEYSLEKFELQLFRASHSKKSVQKENKVEKQTKLPIVDNEEKMSEADKLFARYNVPKRK